MAEKKEVSVQDPYRAKGSDFNVSPAPGGSGSNVSPPAAMCSPRSLESAGMDGPSEWGKGGKSFPVGTNSEGSTSVKDPCGVDLESGSLTCTSHKKTKAGEVPDPKLSIS